MSYKQTSDEEFAAFAKRTQEEADRRNSTGNSYPKSDDYEWMGLEVNTPKILRFVGRPPIGISNSTKVDTTDAHEIFVSRVLSDLIDSRTGKKKAVKLYLPPHTDDITNDHLMHRIIALVSQVEWKLNPKSGPNEKKYIKNYLYSDYPWFNTVMKGGYNPQTDSMNYKVCRGWQGQQMCIMNVIDREDTWCQENKHTKLLSKKISVGNDGRTFPTEGVPSFGFLSLMSTMVAGYGNWERYDVAICRTEEKLASIKVWDVPVSLLKERGCLPGSMIDKAEYIVTDKFLTEDELNYERYNIGELFAPISYKRIKINFSRTISQIDSDLHRNFSDELEELVRKEEEEKGINSNNTGGSSSYMSVPETAPVGAPSSMENGNERNDNNRGYDESYNEPYTRASSSPNPPQRERAPSFGEGNSFRNESFPSRMEESASENVPPRRISRSPAPSQEISQGLTPEKISYLRGWEKLSEYEKSMIQDVRVENGELKEVIYADDAKPCVTCPESEDGCGFPSPNDFLVCPVCGVSFT